MEVGKEAPHGGGRAGAALWKRMSSARSAFAKRRKTYFAALEQEREGVRERKQELVSRAEELSASTDWAATATAYRELMAAWKEAGRADRAAEDELWKRFRAAQATFFEGRSAAMSAEDIQLRRTNPEALSRARNTVDQIRKTVENLEGQLDRANQQGDEAARDRATTALATRRAWLAEAEKTLADLAG